MWSRPDAPAPRPGRRRASLATQVWALQLVVLLGVVAVTSLVSLRQADADFRDTRGARLRTAAEGLANSPVVQDRLLGVAPDAGAGGAAALDVAVQRRQDDIGATTVYLTDPDGTVLVSTDPSRLGEQVELGADALAGEQWSGVVRDRGDDVVAAAVPVYAGARPAVPGRRGRPAQQVGLAVVTERVPPVTERLAQSTTAILVVLGSGLALGAVGSWLLSRLVRRGTRGLEPSEIAALADQREALLTSIREGVVAVSAEGRLTVVSDSARDLLALPAPVAGHEPHLDELDLDEPVAALLRDTDEVLDLVLSVQGRVLVVNRTRVVDRGRPVGTITTLRDRTELLTLQRELTARESLGDVLRAQTHEFANQLHTISGLVQLEAYDELRRLVGTISRRRAEISDRVVERVEDPLVAGLLIAKTTLADERRLVLLLREDSRLPRLDPDLSADVVTVLGNLVDNAMDACGDRGRVEVDLRAGADGAVVVEVADDGPGVPEETQQEIFRRGVSTKAGTEPGGRGVGLALVTVVCQRRGGSVSVHNASGAVFTARLPSVAPHPAASPAGSG